MSIQWSGLGPELLLRLDRDLAEPLGAQLERELRDAIRSGRLALRDAIASGAIKLTDGPPAAAERFFGYFEPPGGAIQLVMR